MLSTTEAAKRLGCPAANVKQACSKGLVAGAVRRRGVGREGLRWYVPASSLVCLGRDNQGRIDWSGRLAGKGPRCTVCGILLAESGDDKHANDAPDAAVCWWCRETRGGE